MKINPLTSLATDNFINSDGKDLTNIVKNDLVRKISDYEFNKFTPDAL